MKMRMGPRGRAATVAGACLALTIGVGAPQAQPAKRTSEAQAAGAERAVSGNFSLVMMVHTNASAGNFNVPTEPWNGALRNNAVFTYRSIACTGNAPVNNIASDLPSYNTRVAGSRAPSSMRAHPYYMRLKRTSRGWLMRGTIVFTVCRLGGGPNPSDDPVPDADKPKINMRYEARFTKVNGELVRYNGRFRIIGGTQRYEDLTGSGSMAGYFFCFQPSGCAANGGNYADGQFVMHGSYRDPTPQLATP